MAYNISAFAGAGAQFFDDNGVPLTGGLLYVYTAGTTTPVTTWTSSSGATANTNPIVLDAAGRTPAEIWLSSGVTYKFILKTSTGVLIGTYDDIPAIDDPTVFNNLITVTGTNTLIGTAVPPYTSYVAGMTLSFIPVAANTGAVTISVDGLGAKNIYTNSSTPLVGGELVVGKIAVIEYDGTRFQLYSATGIPDGSITNAKLADGAVTPSKLSTGGPSWTTGGNLTATGSVKATATGFIFPDTTTQATAAPSTIDVQTFNSTATWTKPAGGYTMARIQVWGGGGGGSRNIGAAQMGSGGGGAYSELTIPLSYLAASLTATVGSGGAGATTTANGANGGTSSVALATAWQGISTLSAYGGGGGVNGSGGGGGGGQLSAGSGATPGTPLGGSPSAVGSGIAASGSVFGGGGGSSSDGGAGGSSVYGGGGGGSATVSASIAAGVSVYGGAGGAGAPSSASAGTQPSGGGGSSWNININGGNGGAGRIIITCW